MKENRNWLRKTRKAGVCSAFLTCLAFASLAAPRASANPTPCLAGTVATVIAQGTCTIGDKTFDFSTYYNYNYGSVSSPSSATGTDVTFTPLTINPLDPGFQLGPFSSTAGDYTYEEGLLYYTVAVTNGSLDLSGVDATVNDPTLATAPSGTDSYANALFEGENYLYSNGGNAYQYGGQSQSTGSSPSTYNYSNSPVTFTPISSGEGYAYFYTFAYDYNFDTGMYGGSGTASVTIPSVDYTFQEQGVGVTPEPGTMLLFGTGLLAAGSIVRRRLFL